MREGQEDLVELMDDVANAGAVGGFDDGRRIDG